MLSFALFVNGLFNGGCGFTCPLYCLCALCARWVYEWYIFFYVAVRSFLKTWNTTLSNELEYRVYLCYSSACSVCWSALVCLCSAARSRVYCWSTLYSCLSCSALVSSSTAFLHSSRQILLSTSCVRNSPSPSTVSQLTVSTILSHKWITNLNETAFIIFCFLDFVSGVNKLMIKIS